MSAEHIQGTRPDDWQDQLARIFAAHDTTRTPGGALAIVERGQLVFAGGYGMANLDHDVPIRPSTVFHVASLSKQFTAAAILLLASDGLVSLDDEVRGYIQELPDFGRRITIRHLIHHTSGLRDQWALLELAGWRYSLDLITDDDVLHAMAGQKRLNFEPGSEELYSNTGYTLLAQIVARVSGQTFRAFTSERIFAPLGMRSTAFRDDHAVITKHLADGYQKDEKTGVFRRSITNFDTVGATSLLTTVEDLARWAANFDAPAPAVGGEALIRGLQQRGTLGDGRSIDYAFGLGHGTYRGRPTLMHSGGDAGYRAHFLRFPEDGVTFICACNLAGINTWLINRQAADIYLADRLTPQPDVTLVTGDADAPASDAAAFPGWYWQREHEFGWRIERDGGCLALRFGPHAKTALSCVDSGRYRNAEETLTLSFAEGEQAGGQRLTAKWDGESHPFDLYLTEEFAPAAEELPSFEGVYRSDEVDPLCRIEARDGQLLLSRFKYKADALRPIIRDYFRGDIGGLRFVRDERGRVTSFVLNKGRIRGMEYVRDAPESLA